MPYVLDLNLRQFATEKQWRYLTAWHETGSQAEAAKLLNCHPSGVYAARLAVERKASQQGYNPENSVFHMKHQVPNGFVLKGQSALVNENGTVSQRWDKTRLSGGERSDFQYVPDPKKIQSTATQVDQTGRVISQWTREVAGASAREEAWQAWADGLKEAIKPIKKIPVSKAKKASDLCAVYPIGDHHLGMLSWAAETGADYDIDIGERLLQAAFDYLIDASPACDTALIASLGDFQHYDSWESVTPTSGNMLDADGRFPKMVRASSRLLRYAIEAALKKHNRVHVIVEIGNHDLASSIWMMELLSQVFEKNPRVTIDTNPGHFHYFQFGKNLVGTHHGHGAKPERLANVMAADVPELWGKTDHRFWMTGHIHHDRVRDFDGVRWESFAVLAPADAYAKNKGYRSRREMKSILLHKEHGEMGRQIFTPGMMG